MQAIKDKLHDMSASREAKAEAKQQEQAEKEFAKAKVDVAHEVRLAKEAEAAMDLHVNKAAELAKKHEAKHPELKSGNQSNQSNQSQYGQDATGVPYTNDDFYAPDGQGVASTKDMSDSKR